jgi:hypothetical protein
MLSVTSFSLLRKGSIMQFDLDDPSFDLLMYACIWHTDKDFTDNITIGTCWDADRLDLGRVGIFPSPQFLSKEASIFIDIAYSWSAHTNFNGAHDRQG